MATRNYYSVLGVRRDASEKDIKQAYRRLARQYHPDVNPGDASAEQKFKEISEAYAVLGNPEARKKYDRFGPQAFAGAGEPPFATGGNFGGFQGGNFTDLFTARGPLSQGFGAFFDEFFGGSGRQRPPRASTRGRDLEQPLEISFEQAIHGTTMPIHVTRRDGSVDRLQVKMPAGVDTGSKIRVAGKGEAGGAKGAAGDLYLVLHVQPHPYFVRRGNDIVCDVPITLTEAMLGAKIEVATVDGKTAMRLPAGTQNGRQFRLRGKGVPLVQGAGRGDQYVTVRVVLPETLDERSREILEEFAVRNPLQPRVHLQW